jgi:hypothetical protein
MRDRRREMARSLFAAMPALSRRRGESQTRPLFRTPIVAHAPQTFEPDFFND